MLKRFLYVFGALAILSAHGTALAKSLVISSPAIPPVSGEGLQPGYLKNIIAEVGKRIGLDVTFKSQPAQRSLKSSNAGRTDGELHRIEGLEKFYPNLIRVPEPVLIDHFVGFAKEPNITVKNWSDTGNLKISYPRGWTIYATTFGEDAVHQPGLHGISLFRMVNHGRIDIAMHTLDKGTYLAQKEGIKLYPVKPDFAIKPMYIYLHKSHAHLIKKFAAAIKEVKEDGTYRHIKKEVLFAHGLTDPAYFRGPFDQF